MDTDGDERVLQRRPRTGMSVYVTRSHAAQPQPARHRLPAPVASAIVAQERPLELDSQALGPERVPQRTQCRLVLDAMYRAAAQADEPFVVREDRREIHRRLPGRRPRPAVARVRVRGGDDPAQVRPAACVCDEQREVAPPVRSVRREIELRAVDRTQPERPGGDGELHRARDRVVIGERHRLIAERQRGRRELVGQRGAVEERERRVAMELRIHGEHMFASGRRTEDFDCP